jgi:hypothetical protein
LEFFSSKSYRRTQTVSSNQLQASMKLPPPLFLPTNSNLNETPPTNLKSLLGGLPWFVNFPQGYWLYEKSKHLWVSGYPTKARLFKTPQEFGIHLLWLLSSSEDSADCCCIHCNVPAMSDEDLQVRQRSVETPNSDSITTPLLSPVTTAPPPSLKKSAAATNPSSSLALTQSTPAPDATPLQQSLRPRSPNPRSLNNRRNRNKPCLLHKPQLRRPPIPRPNRASKIPHLCFIGPESWYGTKRGSTGVLPLFSIRHCTATRSSLCATRCFRGRRFFKPRPVSGLTRLSHFPPSPLQRSRTLRLKE